MTRELEERSERLRHRLSLWGADWDARIIGRNYLRSVLGEVLDNVETLINEAEQQRDQF